MLLLDIDEDGALGVVLNRPSTVPVGEVLPDWGRRGGAPRCCSRAGRCATDAALGGRRLHDVRRDPDACRSASGGCYDDVGIVDLDTPTEIVAARLTRLRIFAGYAGWGAEQLDGEIAEGSWYVVPSTAADLFRADPERAVARRAAPPARRAGLACPPAPLDPEPELTGRRRRSG